MYTDTQRQVLWSDWVWFLFTSKRHWNLSSEESVKGRCYMNKSTIKFWSLVMCKERWAFRGLGCKMNGIGNNEDWDGVQMTKWWRSMKSPFKVTKKRIHQVTAMEAKREEYTKHNTHTLHSEWVRIDTAGIIFYIFVIQTSPSLRVRKHRLRNTEKHQWLSGRRSPGLFHLCNKFWKKTRWWWLNLIGWIGEWETRGWLGIQQRSHQRTRGNHANGEIRWSRRKGFK